MCFTLAVNSNTTSYNTESRSSAGQSATLIMQRSAVRVCLRLLLLKIYQNYVHRDKNQEILEVGLRGVTLGNMLRTLKDFRVFKWGISSAGQSACLARRRSSVRLRYSPRLIADTIGIATRRELWSRLKTFIDILGHCDCNLQGLQHDKKWKYERYIFSNMYCNK